MFGQSCKTKKMASLQTAVGAVCITEQVLNDIKKHDGQKLKAIKIAHKKGGYRGVELTGQQDSTKQCRSPDRNSSMI